MTNTLKFALWNANGLSQHKHELYAFIINHKLDIILISETHFTKKSFIKFHNYKIYHTTHPDGTAHGGTAIIIRNNIKHYQTTQYQKPHIQATNVVVEDWTGPITFSSIYCPPKHSIQQTDFKTFFDTLGPRFICGGDYNSKHLMWGSRLNNTKGRELQKEILIDNLNIVSTREPTYWPTDPAKIPDVLDFAVVKGINEKYFKPKSCYDLSSDHSPVIITVSKNISTTERSCILHNYKTNWNYFRYQVNNQINLHIPLKTDKQIEQAIEHFNAVVQEAAWNSTPLSTNAQMNKNCSNTIHEKIIEKRRLRKQWQLTRSPQSKTVLNKAQKELKKLIIAEKNENFQEYLQNLDATQATDYSLWKATRTLRRQNYTIPPVRTETGKWAKSPLEKAETFATHLKKVFTPNDKKYSLQTEEEIISILTKPYQLELPEKRFTKNEVKHIIQYNIDPKKAPGYDLITGKTLQQLPEKGFLFLTQLFNSIMRLGHFPSQWKLAQITMVLKPGKEPENVQSYRPISLLPIVSKVFEKLILTRLMPIIEKKKLIPPHQFGFIKQHSTIQQVHRVVERVNEDFENNRYCSAVFLDISQAFDKVWHKGLLCKLKQNLPTNYYIILESYINNRNFQVKHDNEYTSIQQILAGVPQGSVLGPILYLIFTADLPTDTNITTATFADDTAILASNKNPKIASEILQNNLNKVQQWMTKWRMKINENKSLHLTFTTRRETCPTVYFNGKGIPQGVEVKYLGMYLDRRLNWKKHIFTKRKQLGHKLRNMYWMLGRKSKLSTENKILIYKSILKPVWTYGLELWGTAAHSNIEIIQRFQSKILRTILGVPWFITNEAIHQDAGLTYVKDDIKSCAKRHTEKLKVHSNVFAKSLVNKPHTVRRLKRKVPLELIN